MGQQQLLLLVLGIVIVGLAVVVGIQAFGENQKKSNQDALINDAVRIASDAQAWALKPAAFGGGANSFTGLTFQNLGYELAGNGCAATEYGNINGCFTMTVTNGTPGSVRIVGTNATSGNAVNVVVSGTSSDNITTGIGS